MKVYMVIKTIDVIDNSNHQSRAVNITTNITPESIIGVYSSKRKADKKLKENANTKLITFEVE